MTRFRELRLQLGLSQEQLCRQYNEKYNRNYTAGAMSLIENDKRSPELGALLDFADFMAFPWITCLGEIRWGRIMRNKGWDPMVEAGICQSSCAILYWGCTVAKKLALG